MKTNQFSVVHLMAPVLLAALDFGLLRYPYFANKLLIFAIFALEWGLFRWASRRDERPYWLGFEFFGWTYVLIDLRYFAEIRHGIVQLAQRPVMDVIFAVLLRIIPVGDPNFFSLLTVLIENAATLLLAVAGGRIAMRLSRQHQGASARK